jgi:DNA-binding LacI/PurR family transcriptional regulator
VAIPARSTLTTVAEAAGVSIATVSNVYNRPARVSEPLRRRVLEAASRLGYTGPDPAGSRLRRGRSDAIGLIFTDDMSFAFEDQAAVGFLAGLARSGEGSTHSLVLVPAGPPGNQDEPAQARPRAAVDSAAVDGFVIYSLPDQDPNLLTAVRRGLPVVVVDQPRNVAGADWVGIDDRAAMRQLGRHLVELGHRKIGVITSRLGLGRRNGPFDVTQRSAIRYAVQRERLNGLCDAMRQAGLDDSELVIEERYDATQAAGASALDALLGRHPDLTAICSLADVLALGALDRARQRGIAVPQRLSLAGFDDIPEATRVGLTTIRQPLGDKGREAGELLYRQMDQPADPPRPRHRRILPTTLEVRATTGPAADRQPAMAT